MAITAGIRLMLGKIKHTTYSTYTSTITAWLTTITAGIRLMLGKIKHKSYST
jgi:uncharacterized hydantoinase/oxoprolinase family protein